MAKRLKISVVDIRRCGFLLKILVAAGMGDVFSFLRGEEDIISRYYLSSFTSPRGKRRFLGNGNFPPEVFFFFAAIHESAKD